MKERHSPFFQTGVLSFRARSTARICFANQTKRPNLCERMSHYHDKKSAMSPIADFFLPYYSTTSTEFRMVKPSGSTVQS